MGDNMEIKCCDEKECKYCNNKWPKSNFRHNRLKCRYCEKLDGRYYRKSDHGKQKSKKWVEENREKMSELQSNWFQKNKKLIYEKINNKLKIDASLKFIKLQRRRICNTLKNKTKKTNELLGCSNKEFSDWMKYLYKNGQSFENHGIEWHIDHVIPISNFNLDNEDEVILCFNWRNTMPLSVKENLSKNNKIILSQVEQHYNKLLEYHQNNNIELPQIFIDLFAKYLVTGTP